MPTETIYLSTRQAARLAGVEPHVLYTSYRRHAEWRGIVPRKGRAGRLSWPAELVRAAVLPHPDQQPNGMDQWFALVERVAPELDQRGVYRLGVALLASEATPGWRPAPGQLTDERLSLEFALMGMGLQSLVERWDQANTGRGAVAQQAMQWLCDRVIGSLKYQLRAAGYEVRRVVGVRHV